MPQLGGHVTRDGLRGFCEQAEELGYGSLWVQEHLFYPLHPVSGYSARPGLKVPDAYRSVLGALETLTAAAAWTTRPVVGTSILVAGPASPVALAQQLATIDLLSEGRLVAGFSVGWSDEEHQVMDVDPRTRGARCDELIDALVACWGPDPVRVRRPVLHHPRGRDPAEAGAAAAASAAVGHALGGRAAPHRREVRHLEPGVRHRSSSTWRCSRSSPRCDRPD